MGLEGAVNVQVTALLMSAGEPLPTDADLVQVDPVKPGALVSGVVRDLVVSPHLRMVAGEDPSLPVNTLATELWRSVTAHWYPRSKPVTLNGPALFIRLDDAGNSVSIASSEDSVFYELLTQELQRLTDKALAVVGAVAPTGCICVWGTAGTDPPTAEIFATHADCTIHGMARN